jgi:hypothetical protein
VYNRLVLIYEAENGSFNTRSFTEKSALRILFLHSLKIRQNPGNKETPCVSHVTENVVI